MIYGRFLKWVGGVAATGMVLALFSLSNRDAGVSKVASLFVGAQKRVQLEDIYRLELSGPLKATSGPLSQVDDRFVSISGTRILFERMAPNKGAWKITFPYNLELDEQVFSGFLRTLFEFKFSESFPLSESHKDRYDFPPIDGNLNKNRASGSKDALETFDRRDSLLQRFGLGNGALRIKIAYRHTLDVTASPSDEDLEVLIGGKVPNGWETYLYSSLHPGRVLVGSQHLKLAASLNLFEFTNKNVFAMDCGSWKSMTLEYGGRKFSFSRKESMSGVKGSGTTAPTRLCEMLRSLPLNSLEVFKDKPRSLAKKLIVGLETNDGKWKKWTLFKLIDRVFWLDTENSLAGDFGQLVSPLFEELGSQGADLSAALDRIRSRLDEERRRAKSLHDHSHDHSHDHPH